MKKILFIHSSSELYGSDRSLLYLMKNLNKEKYELHVVLPCDGPLARAMQSIQGIKVELFEMAILRRKNLSVMGMVNYISEFFISYRYIKKYIKENGIDIVYTNTAVVFPGAVAARHCKVKIIWHIREIIKNKKERFIVSLLVNHYADTIVSNSIATGKAISKNESKLRVVYNSVSEKSVELIKSDNNMTVTIGMAGRINRWKGQKLFVDAAQLIHEKYPLVKFKVAGAAFSGEEWLEEDLKNYIAKKGMTDFIELLGLVTDMDKFYQSIDIFVLPSIQPEPFGLVVIEAMEMAKPVVATKHGGPVEIISDGADGYLVDFLSPVEMAMRCCELIQDPLLRKKIGVAGQLKKREMFSLRSTILGIEKVLNEE